MTHRPGENPRTAHPCVPWRTKSTDSDRSSPERGGAAGEASSKLQRRHPSPTPSFTGGAQTGTSPPLLTTPVKDGSGAKPLRQRIPWERSACAASATSKALVAAPAASAFAVGVTNDSVGVGHAIVSETRPSTSHSRDSSRSTLALSSSSGDHRSSFVERARRPRPGERGRVSGEGQVVAAAAAAAAAGTPEDASAAQSGRRSAASNRPGYISRRGSAAAAATAAVTAVKERRGLSAMPEQGETGGSSLSSKDGPSRGSGDGGSNRRGSVLPSGTRRSDKGVARSDRRRTRGSMEAVTRLTSGNVSYQIGQEIGRGGHGAVFQALNTNTGDFVAIKRMEMDSVKLDAGASIKGEIDLLKKLNHPNIVKYIDTIQTEGHLHIVLEIMESSLSAMCKKFGNFTESLTAIYMTQVLEGLKYLHDQGVLHRDIKGANILTTKHGLIKLADFGVAMKLSDKQEFDVDVVGTPYWMAPEIIEMTGTTTACDVWSVGCTIIELLSGKPPYFDLPQMTALYKIVQDDHPPLPDGISQALQDFLLQCFKKQAQMRKSSVELLRHPWLKNPTNHLRKTMNVENAELNAGEDDTQRRAVLKTVRTAAQLIQTRSPKRRYDLSENDVRDITTIANLDEAAAALPPQKQPGQGEAESAPPPKAVGGIRKGTIHAPAGALAAAKQRMRANTEDAQDWDEDWDQELGFSMPILPEGASAGGESADGGLQPALLTTIAPTSEEAQQRLRALKGAEGVAKAQPLMLKTLDANALDDWGEEEESAAARPPTAATSLRGGGGGAAAGFAGLGRGASAMPSAVPENGRAESFEHSPVLSALGEAGGGMTEGIIGMEATVLRRFMEDNEDEQDDFGGIDIPEDQPLIIATNAEENGPDMRQAEDDDDFAANLKAKMLGHQGSSVTSGGLNAAGANDDDLDDVFGAGFEELTDGEEADTDEKAEREMHAKIGQEVFEELSTLEAKAHAFETTIATSGARPPRDETASGAVGAYRRDGTLSPAALADVSEDGEPEKEPTLEELVVRTCVRVSDMLEGCPQARHYVVSADRGVAPLMFLIQAMDADDLAGEEAVANVLAVINQIVDGNLKALESLAMVGLVAKVINILETRGAWEKESEANEGSISSNGGAGPGVAASESGNEESRARRRRASGSGSGPQMRVEAARLVRALCNGSDLTLQTLISCGGLAVLTQFLDAGPRIDRPGAAGVDARRLVRIGIDGVLHVFSLQRIRRNDFCKLFLRLGLMPRIMDTFTRFLGHAMAASGIAGTGRGSSAAPGSDDSPAPSPAARGFLDKEESMAVFGGGPQLGGRASAGPPDLFWPYLSRAAEILTTFSKSDRVVKEGVAEGQCLEGIMHALSSICPKFLSASKFCGLAVNLLTVLKNVSMEPSTLEALDKAGAITTLVSLLTRGNTSESAHQASAPRAGVSKGGSCEEALENQVLQCMFYLCRLSRKRQEKAAVAGLIPHLQRCVVEQSRLKQFALQMVCDFAHSSSLVRSLMWDEGVLDFYLLVMRSPKDRHWHVAIFRSICAWLSSEGETHRVAGKLVEPSNLDNIILLFCTAQQSEFEEVVEKLFLMMNKSTILVKALGASATFVCEVMKRLHYPKAVVGKTLLGMLRKIHQQHANPPALVRDFDLYHIVLKLSQNESQVLVAELAGQLLQDFDEDQGTAARDHKTVSGAQEDSARAATQHHTRPP